jgi:hypothetical protein
MVPYIYEYAGDDKCLRYQGLLVLLYVLIEREDCCDVKAKKNHTSPLSREGLLLYGKPYVVFS